MNSSKSIGFLSILTLICLFNSCVQSEKNGYSIHFDPRNCTYLWATNCYQTSTEFKGVVYHDYFELVDSTVNVNDFFISVATANKEVATLFKYDGIVYFPSNSDSIGTSQPSLESEIKMSFDNYMKKISKSNTKALIGNSDETSFNVFQIEYRTNGVKSFTISALDAGLFGKNPKESLNKNFEIIRYAPDFIASTETKSLLYGYSDTDKPTNIDEWLSLNPLAQPTMHLRFKSNPSNLPITTRFKINMVTDDGLLLSDTTKAVTLIN